CCTEGVDASPSLPTTSGEFQPAKVPARRTPHWLACRAAAGRTADQRQRNRVMKDGGSSLTTLHAVVCFSHISRMYPCVPECRSPGRFSSDLQRCRGPDRTVLYWRSDRVHGGRIYPRP